MKTPLRGMSFMRVADLCPAALFTCSKQLVRSHSQSHPHTWLHPSPRAMCPRRRLWPNSPPSSFLSWPTRLPAHQRELPVSIWVLCGRGLVLTAYLKQCTQTFSAMFSDVIVYASWLGSRCCTTTVCLELDVSVSLYGPGRMLYRTRVICK